MDFTLEFESRFESGNLQKAVQMWVASTDSSFKPQPLYFHPCTFFTVTDHPDFFPVQRRLRLWAHPAHRHVHQKAHAVVLLQGREHEGWSDLPLHYHQLDEEQQPVFSGHETTPLFWEGGHGERCRMAAHRLQHQILSQLQSGGWTENVSLLNFTVPFPTFPAAFMDIITQIIILEAGFLLKKTLFLHLEHKGRQQWHNPPVLAHLDSPVPSRLRHLLPGPLLPLHLFTPAVLPEAHYLRPSSGVILYTAGAVPQPGWERRVRGDSDVPRGRQGGGPDQEGCGGDGQSPPRRDQQLLDDGGVPRLPARGLGGCSATQGHFCFQGERTEACRLTSVIFPRSLCQYILICLVYFSHMDLWCCRWCRCWILMVWSWAITAALWQAGTSTDITRHCSEILFRVCGIPATWWKGKKSKHVLYIK